MVPGAGQNVTASHHLLENGTAWAFHQSSVALSSGSPRSFGITDARCQTRG